MIKYTITITMQDRYKVPFSGILSLSAHPCALRNTKEGVMGKKPNEPTKEGPLSFVLFESPCTSVSTVSRSHPSLISLDVRCLLDVLVPDQPGGQAVWQQGRPDLLRTLLRCAVCYALRRLRRCLQSWYDMQCGFG